MDFPHGQTVLRDRRLRTADPYNPSSTVAGDWDTEHPLTVPGAFVASSTSTALQGATREQVLTNKSLYLTDPSADVQPGDRIRVGTETYMVQVRPAADVNPFTGWQPVMEIPLELVEG